MNYFQKEYREYFAMYDYLKDLRSGKTTRNQRWNYLNPEIKSDKDETLLEMIINTAIWTAFIARHPLKAGKTYFLALCELFDPSPF